MHNYSLVPQVSSFGMFGGYSSARLHYSSGIQQLLPYTLCVSVCVGVHVRVYVFVCVCVVCDVHACVCLCVVCVCQWKEGGRDGGRREEGREGGGDRVREGRCVCVCACVYL